jgi:MFS transporter, DHA2 family, methylenomycin A resistance protein
MLPLALFRRPAFSTANGVAASMKTARQAGGAIGIAAYGAIAGEPSNVSRFLTGLHMSALITTALFVLAALATLVFIPSASSQNDG